MHDGPSPKDKFQPRPGGHLVSPTIRSAAAGTPLLLLVHAMDDPVSSVDYGVIMYLALKRLGASSVTARLRQGVCLRGQTGSTPRPVGRRCQSAPPVEAGPGPSPLSLTRVDQGLPYHGLRTASPSARGAGPAAQPGGRDLLPVQPRDRGGNRRSRGRAEAGRASPPPPMGRTLRRGSQRRWVRITCRPPASSGRWRWPHPVPACS
jgi:hypothetical protein